MLAVSGCSRLGLFNAVIPKDAGSKLVGSDIAYGADPRQKLDIYAPSAGSSKGVIVFFYGGSWNSGRRQEYEFAGRAFASRGYETVIFDYQLVPKIRYPVFVQDRAKPDAWAIRRAPITR